MVDPVFKAPLPPEAPVVPPEQSQVVPESQAPVMGQSNIPEPQGSSTSFEQPVSVGQTPLPQNSPMGTVPDMRQKALGRLGEIKEKMLPYFWYILAGLFLLGLFFGCSMSGGDSSKPAPAPTGLTNIIRNTYIKGKKQLRVCGMVRPSEACLYYILNNEQIDRVAEDFFEQVALAAGRSSSAVSTENVLYAKTVIKPGYFAEIVVPIRQ